MKTTIPFSLCCGFGGVNSEVGGITSEITFLCFSFFKKTPTGVGVEELGYWQQMGVNVLVSRLLYEPPTSTYMGKPRKSPARVSAGLVSALIGLVWQWKSLCLVSWAF